MDLKILLRRFEVKKILFRGRRIDNGEWVEGYYFMSPLTQENIDCGVEDGWFFLSGNPRHCISVDHVVYEVYPDSVLLLASGKRIWKYGRSRKRFRKK